VVSPVRNISRNCGRRRERCSQRRDVDPFLDNDQRQAELRAQCSSEQRCIVPIVRRVPRADRKIDTRVTELLSVTRRIAAQTPMSLHLAWGSGSEAVDLETSGDADDAGLIFAGREVTGLLGGAGAGPVGPVADEESGVEDLEQERGQGQVKILRGKSPP